MGTAPADLTGTTALVAGASRGIGRAVAVGMSRAGAAVAGLARTAAALEALGDEIADEGGSFLAVPADVADVTGLPEVVDRVWSWRGGIDSLVNAAGITNRSDTLDITPGEWDRLFDVNLRGAFFLTREVGRRMLAAGGGSIVQIASLSGVVSDGAQAAYSAAKAAMIQMSSVLADQWAPGIRVNCVSPGWVATGMTKDFLAKEENMEAIYRHTPMRRVARPEEIVGPVLFLVSEMSSYMTGQNLVVDGGWTA